MVLIILCIISFVVFSLLVLYKKRDKKRTNSNDNTSWRGLTLAQIDATHADEIFRLASANKEFLNEWLSWVAKMQSVQFMRDFILMSLKRISQGIELAFVIKSNDKIVGRVGIYKLDNPNEIGEIGYWVGREYQGRGIVTRSCTALADYCFNELALNRIEIRCGTENYKSQLIADRLHFTCEGTMRQGEKLNGTFIDLSFTRS
jgi:ribosomal-protein-serine acetyltransferase